MYCDSVCSGMERKIPNDHVKLSNIKSWLDLDLYHIIIHHILTILSLIHLNGINLEDFDLFCFHRYFASLLYAFCQY